MQTLTETHRNEHFLRLLQYCYSVPPEFLHQRDPSRAVHGGRRMSPEQRRETISVRQRGRTGTVAQLKTVVKNTYYTALRVIVIFGRMFRCSELVFTKKKK